MGTEVSIQKVLPLVRGVIAECEYLSLVNRVSKNRGRMNNDWLYKLLIIDDGCGSVVGWEWGQK